MRTDLEKTEKISLNEQLSPKEPIAVNETELSDDTIGELFLQRQESLANMKQWVGLKFYYRATEKIKQEEAQLKKLLRLENAKQDILAEYTFVLDQAYFEQKFLSN